MNKIDRVRIDVVQEGKLRAQAEGSGKASAERLDQTSLVVKPPKLSEPRNEPPLASRPLEGRTDRNHLRLKNAHGISAPTGVIGRTFTWRIIVGYREDCDPPGIGRRMGRKKRQLVRILGTDRFTSDGRWRSVRTGWAHRYHSGVKGLDQVMDHPGVGRREPRGRRFPLAQQSHQ